MCRSRSIVGLVAALATVLLTELHLQGQDDPTAAATAADETQSPSEAIVIPDEPRTIDPARFVPEPLGRPVTVEFEEVSLTDVAAWIRDELGVPVLFDETSLRKRNILVGDTIRDRLLDAPMYLLLDRLDSIGLGWLVEDGIIRITTVEEADDHLSTMQHNIGDLLDAGYDSSSIEQVITNQTSGPWFDLDGIGGTEQVLGDVLFVRQNFDVQREVAAVIEALRKHGRMTFIHRSPQDLALRDKLLVSVTAGFDQTPLNSAIEELARQASIDIRLDEQALEDLGLREREPVSLQLDDRPLGVVLELLLTGMGLTYFIEDGVMLITTLDVTSEQLSTAVFDVRDLSRDDDESVALLEAVQRQTQGPWFDLDGIGGTIDFPLPGTMVVRQTQQGLYELLSLLETYRAALRASKPRPRNVIDPNEYIVTYYRMPAEMAADLVNLLPILVKPETWRSDDHPDAQGYALVAASGVELRDVHGRTVVAPEDPNEKDSRALVVQQSVLIVNQSRNNHEEVSEVIRRVQQGDAIEREFPGGNMGGGGFGGGFFSTPPAADANPPAPENSLPLESRSESAESP